MDSLRQGKLTEYFKCKQRRSGKVDGEDGGVKSKKTITTMSIQPQTVLKPVNETSSKAASCKVENDKKASKDQQAPEYQQKEKLKQLSSINLPLPAKYQRLIERFRHSDMIVGQLFNRKEQCTFRKLCQAVETVTRNRFSRSQIGQVVAVKPTAFRISVEIVSDHQRTSSAMNKDLVIYPDFTDAAVSEDKVTPSFLSRRLLDFRRRLLDKTFEAHREFLKLLPSPIVVDDSKLRRWHPEFDLESAPEDIEPAVLPEIPSNIPTAATGRKLLEFGKNIRSKRILKALEKVANNSTTVLLSSKQRSSTTCHRPTAGDEDGGSEKLPTGDMPDASKSRSNDPKKREHATADDDSKIAADFTDHLYEKRKDRNVKILKCKGLRNSTQEESHKESATSVSSTSGNSTNERKKETKAKEEEGEKEQKPDKKETAKRSGRRCSLSSDEETSSVLPAKVMKVAPSPQNMRGIPLELLNRIREREAEDKLEKSIVETKEYREESLKQQLPVIVRTIRNYFSMERKIAIPRDMVKAKVTECVPGLSAETYESCVAKLLEKCPEWISSINIGNKGYLKIRKTTDIGKIIDKITNGDFVKTTTTTII